MSKDCFRGDLQRTLVNRRAVCTPNSKRRSSLMSLMVSLTAFVVYKASFC